MKSTVESRLLASVARWAEKRDDVHAVILVGSRARTGTPADRWSDTDLVLIVDEPFLYMTETRWLEAFGGYPLLTFLEPTAVGGAIERRVLYDTGADVDFALVATALAYDTFDPDSLHDVRPIFQRGYRVLVDKDGFAAVLPRITGVPERPEPPSQADFDQLTHDFWYHAVWTARKLRRGELWTAKEGCDGLLHRLLTLMRWHAEASDPGRDTWHGSRFVEHWADARAVGELAQVRLAFDARVLEAALTTIGRVFAWVQGECASVLELRETVPMDDVDRLIAEVLRAPSSGEEPEQKPEEEHQGHEGQERGDA